MTFSISERRAKDRGFSLIEIIVSLVVLGIMGAMLVTFMTSSVVQSANPVIQAMGGSYLNRIMETITADYKYLMATNATPINALRTKINTYTNYSSYPYDIVENHRISFAGDPPTEQQDGSGKTLKVTIGYQGLTLTALFSE
jgi:prepilin-type N-terminal cleavage/methylation domain-containing protein